MFMQQVNLGRGGGVGRWLMECSDWRLHPRRREEEKEGEEKEEEDEHDEQKPSEVS